MEKNKGDLCKTESGNWGRVNEDCDCIAKEEEKFDCPELEKNKGDYCVTKDRKRGEVNDDCECEAIR